MWVGRDLGDVALAALSNANLLWIALFAASFGVSMAGAVQIGRNVGKGDVEAARAAVGTTLSVSGAISILCVLVMEVSVRPLLKWLGTPGLSVPQAVEYLRVLLLSVPLSYLYGAAIEALRAAGDSKTAFQFSCISIATDVLLNPCLIRGIGPMPALGIVGSAIATLISQGVGLIGLVGCMYRRKHPLCLRGRDIGLLRIDRAIGGVLLRQGSPMAAQFLWGTVESLAIISLVNRFGVDTTAAYGAFMQIWNLISMPAVALGVATTSILAQNIGAMRWDRVRAATHLGLAYGVLISAVLVMLAEVLDWRAFRLFLPDGSPALVIANQINREATWAVIAYGGYAVWVGVLRAAGIVWAPLIISFGVLAVRFPAVDALLRDWHAQAIWWSFPASTMATGALAVLHTRLSRPAHRLLRGDIQPSILGF
jgi:putative MATE family efflux protein